MSQKANSATPTLEKLVVIGGGPAGLEFARVAAQRGYSVSIWEEASQPGGQLRLAAVPPGRGDFQVLVDYLYRACQTAGVEFIFDKKASPEELTALADTDGVKVIVTAGAKPLEPPFPVDPAARIVQAWDVLAGQVEVGSRAVIVGGGAVGVETAIYLAHKDTISDETLRFLIEERAESPEEIYRLLHHTKRSITLIEMAKGIGRDIGLSTRWSMLASLARYRIQSLDQTMVTRITHEAVIAKNGEQEIRLPYDTVILAIGSRPLAESLLAQGSAVTVFGDALKPRKAFDAIHEAHRAALAL